MARGQSKTRALRNATLLLVEKMENWAAYSPNMSQMDSTETEWELVDSAHYLDIEDVGRTEKRLMRECLSC